MKLLGPPTGLPFILMRVKIPKWYCIEYFQNGITKESFGPEVEREIIVFVRQERSKELRNNPVDGMNH